MPFFAGMFDPPASVAPNNASYTPAIQVGVVRKPSGLLACVLWSPSFSFQTDDLARQDKRSGTSTENWTANPTRVRVCTQCESDAHIALARRAVRESIVLLKNKNGVLPLSTADFQGKKDSLAVTFL